MSTFSDYRFTPFAEHIRSCCRKSLLSLGKSTNARILSLPDAFLEERKENPYARFLLSLKRHGQSLNEFERRILLSEAIERGLHYRYWYVSFIGERDYRRLRAKVCLQPFHAAKTEGLWLW